MVLVSSRLGRFAATRRGSLRAEFTPRAPLLPKVRGQLAEFLNQGSLVHLSFFSQPTCVGLRYGQEWSSVAGLSRLFGFSALAARRMAPARTRLSVSDGADLPPPSPYRLGRSSSDRRAYPSASRIRQTVHSWYRNVYLLSIGCCLRIPLGPTNPPRITLAAEPSGFRWRGFAPRFAVTRSGIRTRRRSTAGFRRRFAASTTLPYHPDGPELRYDPLPRWIVGAAALDQ